MSASSRRCPVSSAVPRRRRTAGRALAELGGDAGADHGLRRSAERGRQLLAEYDGARDELPRRRRRSCCTASWRAGPRSPTSASCPATGRPARRRQVTSRCTARASTSTPTCTRSTSTGRGCRSASAPGWRRALRHYGVTDLEPGPALEEAVFRVFLAQERAADQIPSSPGCWSAGGTPGLPAGAAARRARRGGRAAGRRHPAALPVGRRPGPQPPLPVLRASR